MSTTRLLVIDAGTTGIRAIVFDSELTSLGEAATEFGQFHPGQDRVEQDAEEIWTVASTMAARALRLAGTTPDQVTAIGIANQRATTVVWDRRTGKPITRAIVWQDTRTAARVDELAESWGEKTYSRTGWALAPVYSSLSIEWILRNVPGAEELADAGHLAFGTVDSWLIYRFTGGREHVIAASNASVTGAYDLTTDDWYTDWLGELGIPASMFPEVRSDSGDLGTTAASVFGAEVPIRSAIADQQSALFAQHCLEPGMVKCTHGTGTFLDMNVGAKPVIDTSSGLNAMIAWRIDGVTTYNLEGYAAVTGAAVGWLRDGIGIISTASEVEAVAGSVPDSGGVYFVPALAGLSAPYWDSYARGTIFGITPGTTRGHLARATLEGIVYSIRDFIDAMGSVSGRRITTIAADGGASRNDMLLQFQADQLGIEVVRPANIEATALGAALLAGLAADVWATTDEAFSHLDTDVTFTPQISAEERARGYDRWTKAVSRSRDWARA